MKNESGPTVNRSAGFIETSSTWFSSHNKSARIFFTHKKAVYKSAKDPPNAPKHSNDQSRIQIRAFNICNYLYCISIWIFKVEFLRSKYDGYHYSDTLSTVPI